MDTEPKALAEQIHDLRGRFPQASREFLILNFGVLQTEISNERAERGRLGETVKPQTVYSKDTKTS
jgi:hypothetical protein